MADFSSWSHETLAKFAADATAKLLRQDEEISLLRKEIDGPPFTDSARAALLWVLWHHQGSSSPIGQALRFALGMGEYERLTEAQVIEARKWGALRGLQPTACRETAKSDDW